MEQEFDAATAEAHELDLHLLDKGMSFTVPEPPHRFWFMRPFQKKERTFTIYQPFPGTLDYLGRELLEIEFDEKRLEENPVSEVKYLAAMNARRCARIVAIMVLQYQHRIKNDLEKQTDYFMDSITPAKLFQIVNIIHRMANFKDFTNSSRYLSILPRTTTPKLEEKKIRGEQRG